MTDITQRCRQCGWVHEVRPEQIPRHGARVRCGECGSLLPLLSAPVGQGGDNGGREVQSDPVRLPVLEGAEPAGPRISRPARGEAREILRLWIKEVARGEPRPLTESVLFREYGAELTRLLTLWQASYPGPEATEIFKEELRAAAAGAMAEREK